MGFFALIFFACMTICVNGTKIYLYGEFHGEIANQHVKISFERYKNGEIEFLGEGTPPGLNISWDNYKNNGIEVLEAKPLMLEHDLALIMNDLTISRLLFLAATNPSEKLYHMVVKFLKDYQRNQEEDIINLPNSWETGRGTAKKLFYERWHCFRNTAANKFWFLEGWRNYKLPNYNNPEKIREDLDYFQIILDQFRNLSWAQKIAKKFKESKKDLHVHFGENHRKPIENMLQTFHDIPKEQIYSEYLEDTKID